MPAEDQRFPMPPVIDELMGHQCSRHGELDGGSRVGARYRHTTVDMAARMVDAIEARLAIVPRAAGDQASLDQGTVRVARLWCLDHTTSAVRGVDGGQVTALAGDVALRYRSWVAWADPNSTRSRYLALRRVSSV